MTFFPPLAFILWKPHEISKESLNSFFEGIIKCCRAVRFLRMRMSGIYLLRKIRVGFGIFALCSKSSLLGKVFSLLIVLLKSLLLNGKLNEKLYKSGGIELKQ